MIKALIVPAIAAWLLIDRFECSKVAGSQAAVSSVVSGAGQTA